MWNVYNSAAVLSLMYVDISLQYTLKIIIRAQHTHQNTLISVPYSCLRNDRYENLRSYFAYLTGEVVL